MVLIIWGLQSLVMRQWMGLHSLLLLIKHHKMVIKHQFTKIKLNSVPFGKFPKVRLPLHAVLLHDLSRKAEGLGPAMP
jgi:hypothetical protein